MTNWVATSASKAHPIMASACAVLIGVAFDTAGATALPSLPRTPINP
ncbi:MAG TPA: hypothetical protein VGH10_04145 [Actinomycetota bacterium]